MIIKTPRVKTGLQNAIDEVLLSMQGHAPDSLEYAKMADQLVKLHKLTVDERPQRVSYDTLVTIFAHIAGIVIIVAYERANVVTSKALNFVQKLK